MCFIGVRQLPPNVIGVAGLHIEEPKMLTGVRMMFIIIDYTGRSDVSLYLVGSKNHSRSGNQRIDFIFFRKQRKERFIRRRACYAYTECFR